MGLVDRVCSPSLSDHRDSLEPVSNKLLQLKVLVKTASYDNYLLAMASAGAADFLLTGDKRDLLGLKVFEGTKIVTVRDFLVMHRRLP
jgi:predicted nucleic acid-binding protein